MFPLHLLPEIVQPYCKYQAKQPLVYIRQLHVKTVDALLKQPRFIMDYIIIEERIKPT